MKRFVTTLSIFMILTGCTNYYSKNYQDLTGGMSLNVMRSVAQSCEITPEILNQEINEQLLEDLNRDNYTQIGESFFTAMLKDKSDAVSLAKEKCANLILLSTKYEGTRRGTNTVIIPTQETVTSDISGRITGPYGGSNFTGTATTTVQGYQSIPISYAHDLYSHKAYFFTKTKKNSLGVNVRDLPEELKERWNTNRGVIISTVSFAGTAFAAGLRKGDVIKKIDDDYVLSAIGFEKAVTSSALSTMRFEIIRDMSLFTINVEKN